MSNTAPTPNNEALAALSAKIMNLPAGDPGLEPTPERAYRLGHRDARHAAAELVDAALASSGQAASAVPGVNESIEYEVVQDGCVQFDSPSLEEANAWAQANGPWAMSIYRNHRTLISKGGQPASAPAREVAVPDAVFEIVQRVYDNIEPGALAENRAHIESIVQPYLDAIMDELRELDATPSAKQGPTAREVARQTFALCEWMEETPHAPPTDDLSRQFQAGKAFAAKHIRNGVGNWLTDEENRVKDSART